MLDLSTSLADFLGRYIETNPEDAFVVEEEVDINLETTAYFEALKDRNQLIWFKRIKGFDDFTLVTNVLGSIERMAFALGTSSKEIYHRWEEIVSHSVEFDISSNVNAPVKERIFKDTSVDLFSLPAPRHYLLDGSNTGFGRYVTSGLAVARDPLSKETINMSYTRIQIIDSKRYAFDMGSRGHFWKYVQTAKEAGENLPVSVVIGAHPLYYMLAASFIENEYSKAARVIKSEYVRGELNDIPVPSDAEIVIEAEVLPDEHFEEGPFSEFTGYMARRSTGNVARVKSILRKKNPVYYDIAPSNSSEHVGLFSTARNSAILKGVREYMPPAPTYCVEWPLSGSHFIALSSIDRAEPGLAKQFGILLLGLDPLFSKIVFVNEGKSELTLDRLLANLALTGAKKAENVEIISEAFNIKLDPSSDSRGTNGKMIIVTKSSRAPYQKVVETQHKVRLVVESSEVVFSHDNTSEGNVNIILDRDIDLTSPNQIIWALSTRLRPDKDVSFEDGRRIIFRATKPGLEVPTLPEELLNRIKARVRNKR